MSVETPEVSRTDVGGVQLNRFRLPTYPCLS